MASPAGTAPRSSNDGHHGNEKIQKYSFYQCKHPFAPFLLFSNFPPLLFQGVLSARQGRAQAFIIPYPALFCKFRCFSPRILCYTVGSIGFAVPGKPKKRRKAHEETHLPAGRGGAAFVCCALPAFAEASGVSRADYTITAYSVDATLHENNTVTQTERITVDFAVPSPGYLPRAARRPVGGKEDTADGPQEMAYRAECGTLP